ncbi:MAG: PIN domain nuclease [Pseudomonadales bacterium]|nr:PIN domain nuclease [Pseudomonadales bacterium]
MNALFDTNVILDLLLDREPFNAPATWLISQAEAGAINGSLCATTLTNIFYIASKALNRQQAATAVANIMSIFEVAPVTRAVIEDALTTPIQDFEDAVLYQSAIHYGCQLIVTRNTKDFTHNRIPVMTPDEFIALLHST